MLVNQIHLLTQHFPGLWWNGGWGMGWLGSAGSVLALGVMGSTEQYETVLTDGTASLGYVSSRRVGYYHIRGVSHYTYRPLSFCVFQPYFFCLLGYPGYPYVHPSESVSHTCFPM